MKTATLTIRALAPAVLLSAWFAVRPAHADFPMKCSEMTKGDVAACTAKAKAKCQTGEYLQKARCEETFARADDACLNGSYERACKAALPLTHQVCGDFSLRLDNEASVTEFIRRGSALRGAVATYDQFHTAWKVCYRSRLDRSLCDADDYKAKQCSGAPARFAKKLSEVVDPLLAKHALAPAQAAVAAPKLDTSFANKIDAAQRDAKLLKDFAAKLPAELRYKDAEIQAFATSWAEVAAAYEVKFEAYVETQKCPAGSPAGGEFAKQVQTEWNDAGWKLRATRITGATQRTTDPITKTVSESIPAVICREKTEGDKPKCSYSSISFNREKPAGAAWTDWKIHVGNDARISCKL